MSQHSRFNESNSHPFQTGRQQSSRAEASDSFHQQTSRQSLRELGRKQRSEFWKTVLSSDSQEASASAPQLTYVPSKGDKGSASMNDHSRAETRRLHGSSSSDAHASASGSAKKEAPCPVCHTLFKRKYDLLQHISAVHHKIRKFRCEVCSASFAHKGTLSKHIRTVHLGEKPYVCEHCGSRFSERGNVNKHKQRAMPCRRAEEALRNNL